MSSALVTAAEVAAATVTVLSPYLSEAGKEAAKSVGKEVAGQGFKLLGWLRDKLTGRGAEALTALEEKPERETRKEALTIQLREVLEDNPALLDELRALLTEETPQGHSLIQTVNGDNNKVAQVSGSGNSVSIS
ncbi:hypothetical protein A6A40_21060 (plasmid) [Azospirillum humicireducens]|uniref:Uncharacterized protein n=1 Tax=Azospirillum humicireducens TaxID=1226968 RepID=A0A2R4VSV8_9PROT|nr:hypothetical protein [Azospirillum humicireducens]AWB07515.1 hypothetical protein A6A40_21060 [Azospirillum humicireducens]